MTDTLDLEAMRAQVQAVRDDSRWDYWTIRCLMDDILALIAEVERLRDVEAGLVEDNG